MTDKYCVVMKCPVCGEEFIPAPEHIYNIKPPNRPRKLVCSYHCMRAWEKEKERKKNAKMDKC